MTPESHNKMSQVFMLDDLICTCNLSDDLTSRAESKRNVLMEEIRSDPDYDQYKNDVYNSLLGL